MGFAKGRWTREGREEGKEEEQKKEKTECGDRDRDPDWGRLTAWISRREMSN